MSNRQRRKNRKNHSSAPVPKGGLNERTAKVVRRYVALSATPGTGAALRMSNEIRAKVAGVPADVRGQHIVRMKRALAKAHPAVAAQ